MTIAAPPNIARLPQDRRGYHVPKFVAWIKGTPDFRVVDPDHLWRCINVGVCWICGERLGRWHTYVTGPMCVVNRTSGEPPSHHECAVYAARACPFLSLPEAKRREAGLPDEVVEPAGIGIRRNPGVTALWVTRRPINPFPDQNMRPLFRLPMPVERIEWMREGRDATRAEVLHSITTGCPTLQSIAEQEGERAVLALRKQVDWALGLIEKPPFAPKGVDNVAPTV